MIHQSSYQTRRLIGQLQKNEEIIGKLTALCEELSIKAGEVRLSGALKSIELSRFDATKKEYVKAHHGGPVEIITLHGTIATIGEQIALRLDALVSSEQGFGVQLASGQVSRAVVGSCEFVLDAFDDIAMTRGLDGESGRMVLTSIESTGSTDVSSGAQAAPAPAQSSISWDNVSAASSDPSSFRRPAPTPEERAPEPAQAPAQVPKEAPPQTKEEPEKKPEIDTSLLGDDDDFAEDDTPEMKPGDILDHPKLGRCRIMKVEEDDYAHIRLPRGKISKLILHIFDIHYKGKEEGRNVFSLRMRK